MEIMSVQQFDEYRLDAKVLEKDGHGEKVLLTAKGEICKLFRNKRAISTARLYPYAQRFADNAKSLLSLGIPSITVTGLYQVPHLQRDIVVYPLLEGETLRDYLAKFPEKNSELVMKMAEFIASLHKKGVYFRSLHFGNVLVLPNGEMGLIDVSDMKITGRPLKVWTRVRNFKAILRYEEDITVLEKFGVRNFLDLYREHAGVSLKAFEFCLKYQRKHPIKKLL